MCEPCSAWQQFSCDVTIISKYLAIPRFTIGSVNKPNNNIISDEASVIRELLYMRYLILFTPNCTAFLSHDELNIMIETLFTM